MSVYLSETKDYREMNNVRSLVARAVFLLPLIPIVLTAGCGSDTGIAAPPLAIVTGLVSDAGQPVANAIVEFFPETGRSSVGRTNEDGAYALKYSDAAGAVIGVCRVQITPGVPTAATGEDVVAPPMKGPPRVIMVPQEITVIDGKNKCDFDLADFTLKR